MPFLAISIASLSRSVANICNEKPPWGLIFSSTSLNTIANEYASSPVEHPGTHARNIEPG